MLDKQLNSRVYIECKLKEHLVQYTKPILLVGDVKHLRNTRITWQKKPKDIFMLSNVFTQTLE